MPGAHNCWIETALSIGWIGTAVPIGWIRQALSIGWHKSVLNTLPRNKVCEANVVKVGWYFSAIA